MSTPQPQGQGPSEVVRKLVFPFLKWEELIKSGDLVCKRWRDSLNGDDVWQPLCDQEIGRQESIMRMRREYQRETGMEEEDVGACILPKHEILATQMKKRSVSGRSYREIFILSERMGRAIFGHELRGPDKVSRLVTAETRSRREKCEHECQWIVGPTIETLREVFTDSSKKERLEEISEMKSKLLKHARNELVIKRMKPYYMEKEQIAAIMGKYFLAAATMTSKSCDENAFDPLSGVEATVEEVVDGIERVTGKELETPMSIQLKRTPTGLEKEFVYHQPAMKKLRGSLLNNLDWPMSPIDGLCSLVHSFWPSFLDCDFTSMEDRKEAAWDHAVNQWWISLAEPIRKIILDIYQEQAQHYADSDPIPQHSETSSIPLTSIKLIVEAKYEFCRKRIAESICRDLDPCLRDSIFKTYTQHSHHFCDVIRQDYHAIYGERDPELNAKVLLDIFLEVIPHKIHTHAPKMTSDYCSVLMETMENVMDRWNQLVNLVQSEDNVLWDPQTLIAMKSFESKFDTKMRGGDSILESRPGLMIERFLYQLLSSASNILDYFTLKPKLEQMIEDTKNKVATHTDTKTGNTTIQEVVDEYKHFSSYAHVREHAMIALIPLLPNLSEFDSKRLIYAIFVQEDSYNKAGFSKKCFTDLWAGEIPCSKSEFADNLENIGRWINSNSRGRHFSMKEHGVVERLFGLPLPLNIICAMAQFLLERLYNQSLNDVTSITYRKAIGVLPYMERFCYENPERASVVWDCLEQAIINAINVVHELDVDDIEEQQSEAFSAVICSLLCSCINTRARNVIPAIRRLYEDTQFSIQPPNRISLESLIQKINEAPQYFADTAEYHSIYYDDLL